MLPATELLTAPRTGLATMSVVFIVLTLAQLAPVSAPLFARDGDKPRLDHETALSALNRGEIVRLDIVLAAVKNEIPGEFVGVQLIRRRGDWIYEFKMLSPEGAAFLVEADARTGNPTVIKPTLRRKVD